jgi:3-oxoadipate enol-lactonase
MRTEKASRLNLGDHTVYYERAGAGPPTLVFLHGGMIDSRLWDQQFDWFAAHADVIRFDLPGDGRSEAPALNWFSGIEDLGTLLDLLAIEQASVIGLSGGARIGIDFAISHPPRIDKLVAVAPGLSGYTSWTLPADRIESGRAAIRRGDRERAVTAWLDLWAPVTKDALLDLARANAESLFTNTHLVDLDPPAIGRLNELAAPVLVIVGDKDVPDTLAIANIIVAGAPDATSQRIDGADHFPNVYAPQNFNRLVAEFVLKQAPSPSG